MGVGGVDILLIGPMGSKRRQEDSGLSLEETSVQEGTHTQRERETETETETETEREESLNYIVMVSHEREERSANDNCYSPERR